MRSLSFESTNPALHNDQAFQQLKATFAGEDVTTMQGVVNKTGILLTMAVAAGAGAYALLPTTPSLLWISTITAFIVTLGVYFVIYGNPARARVLAPVYAITQGAFLGTLSCALDGVLEGMNKGIPGGVAVQAFIITISILLAMLGLYKARILQPTRMFVSVVKVATAGIMITYLLSFVVGLFGVGVPFLSLGSAMQGGSAAWIGVGINVLILGVASMWLIIDFRLVEDLVNRGEPRVMEWYAGFALMVTLAWIYYESVKLVFRLAIILGNRD